MRLILQQLLPVHGPWFTKKIGFDIDSPYLGSKTIMWYFADSDQIHGFDFQISLSQWIKKWISPEQNPVWFPLEQCTQGVKVDLFLWFTIGTYHN